MLYYINIIALSLLTVFRLYSAVRRHFKDTLYVNALAIGKFCLGWLL